MHSSPVPRAFSYGTRATRIVFGVGALDGLDAELQAMGAHRVLVVSTGGRSRDLDDVRAVLGARVIEVFTGARQHVPVEVVRAALDVVRTTTPDSVLSLGGGSAIGLGKAIARETSLPHACVPTTYAGSEMTSIWGTSEGRVKQTGRDARVAPQLVVYDPALTVTLPPATSAASGMNAIAHAVEALYAADASPVSSLCAEDGLRRLAESLPIVVGNPGNISARVDVLIGAHLCACALDLTTMGLHHKLCHALGGIGLAHAETHAAVLPYVVGFNAPAAADAMRRIAEALGAPSATAGLFALSETLGTRRSLAELGLLEADIAPVAMATSAASRGNPRPVTEDDVRDLLVRALHGD